MRVLSSRAMSDASDDERVVSISRLVAALRGEHVTEGFIGRILVAVFEFDEATARAYAQGRVPEPEPELVAEPELVEPEPEAEPVDEYAALHAMLTAAHERGDWPAFVNIVSRIVEIEDDPKRQAKYLYTLALVQRDQIKDVEAALETLERVLDSDPTMLAAFERQRSILTAKADWKSLERAHRKMIRRVLGQGDTALEFGLWQALGQIYRDRLDHGSAAIEAFKMALSLRPGDAETLAALHGLGYQPE